MTMGTLEKTLKYWKKKKNGRIIYMFEKERLFFSILVGNLKLRWLSKKLLEKKIFFRVFFIFQSFFQKKKFFFLLWRYWLGITEIIDNEKMKCNSMEKLFQIFVSPSKNLKIDEALTWMKYNIFTTTESLESFRE